MFGGGEVSASDGDNHKEESPPGHKRELCAEVIQKYAVENSLNATTEAAKSRLTPAKSSSSTFIFGITALRPSIVFGASDPGTSTTPPSTLEAVGLPPTSFGATFCSCSRNFSSEA